MERVFVNVQRYGNMSSATVPVALCEALEEGRVRPGALLLMPGFGGGLTFTAHVVRWGERITPLRQSHVEAAAVREVRARDRAGPRGREATRYFLAARFFFLAGSFGLVLPKEPW